MLLCECQMQAQVGTRAWPSVDVSMSRYKRVSINGQKGMAISGCKGTSASGCNGESMSRYKRASVSICKYERMQGHVWAKEKWVQEGKYKCEHASSSGCKGTSASGCNGVSMSRYKRASISICKYERIQGHVWAKEKWVQEVKDKCEHASQSGWKGKSMSGCKGQWLQVPSCTLAPFLQPLVSTCDLLSTCKFLVLVYSHKEPGSKQETTRIPTVQADWKIDCYQVTKIFLVLATSHVHICTHVLVIAP